MLNLKCVTFLCLSLGIIGANSGKVSFIKACRPDDDDCILESSRAAQAHIVNGISELGLASFNPMHMDKVDASLDNFELIFENIEIHNIPKCKITKMRRPEKLKLDAEVDCPITINGTYSIPKDKGNLLNQNIYGHGGFNIETVKTRSGTATLRVDCKVSGGMPLGVLQHKSDTDHQLNSNRHYQILLKILAILKTIFKDGQEYYKITGFDYSYDAKKKVHITLDNLFDGDKAKAEPFTSLLDTNWKELVDVLGGKVIKAFLKVAFERIDGFFSKIPANELELQ